MKEYIENFLDDLKFVEGKSENTVKTYEQDLRQFYNFISEIGIDMQSITQQTIREFIYSLRSNGRSAKTINRKITCLRLFFRYLSDVVQEINHNPTIGIKNLKSPKNLPKWLPVEEVEKLINKPKPIEDQLIIELLYGSGIRVSELTGIQIKDILLNQKRILIKGKGSKERYVPISENALVLLKNFVNNKTPEENLIPLTTRSVQRRLKKYLPNLTPHMLRHSFGTHILQNGGNIKSVQEILGHEKLTTTAIYLHVSPDIAIKDYEKSHPRAKLKH